MKNLKFNKLLLLNLSLFLSIGLISLSCTEEKDLRLLNEADIISSKSSSNFTSSGSTNVKLLTFNAGLGAGRLYGGSCSTNSNPPLSDIVFGDFNNDGIDDVFSIFSNQWRYASGGENGWMDLNSSTISLNDLRFGDFNGDGKTDVFSKSGNQWRYSSGGDSSWTNLNSASTALSDLRFGDFNGDGKTDVFSKSGNQWRYSSGGVSSWINLNSASIALNNLRFGDFNGDGKTDVFSKSGNQWRYSSGGVSSWINLTTDSSTTLENLRFGDFNGDGKTDVFSKSGNQWRYSSGGVSSWTNLNSASTALSDLRFADLNGDGKTDIFSKSSGKYRYSSGGVSSWINLDSSYMLYCNTQSSCVKPMLLIEESIEEIVNLIKTEFSGQDGIVCLQEVNTNIGGVNILESIKTELGGSWDYEFYSPLGNTYGIATLSNIEHTKKQLWALPQYNGNEKRGAIAQKFKFQDKFAWIVNTHLGLANAEREIQVDSIISKYQTFSSTTPVVIVGDFNIIDRYRHGSSVNITSSQETHYDNTVQELIDSGLKKLDYDSNESFPYTFHSWNGTSKAKILDYVLYKDPDGNDPEVSNWTCGPFNSDGQNSICPDIFPTLRYASDHNGILLDYNIFGI